MTDPLRSTLSPGAAADAPPPVLLPYQQAWVADDAALKVAEKSRRIGLTWGEAADDALIAAADGGSNVFYISATQDMALEYIEAAAMWARVYDLAGSEIQEGVFDDGDKEIKTYRIDFPRSGRRIVALSSRPANLRGKQGVIVIDEAAFAPDLAGLLKAAMAMLMWGDKVRIISTHDGTDNPFNELIEQVRAGKRRGSVHRITFEQAVADGLFRRVCMRKGRPWSAAAEAEWVAQVRGFYADDAEEELDVIPSKGGGTYLPLALLESRQAPGVPIVRMRWSDAFGLLPEPVRAAEVADWIKEALAPHLAGLDKARRHGFGEDFARSGDLTVLPVLEEGADTILRVRLVVEIGNCPFSQQKQIIGAIGDGLPRFYSAALDATGNGADLAEWAADKWGRYRIEQVKLTDAFYLENMPRFKAALEDATLDNLPQDDQTRDDLRAIKRINGTPKIDRNKTQRKDAEGKRVQRHGDFAIGLFLGHYAMKRDVAPIEFTGVPASSGRWSDTPSTRRDDDDDDARDTDSGAW